RAQVCRSSAAFDRCFWRNVMRGFTTTACVVLVHGVSCNFDPLPKLTPDAPMGSVSLTASPSVFILHQYDTRDTTLTLGNGTSGTIGVPAFTVSGLLGGTMGFSGSTCGAQLAPDSHCSVKGHLIITDTAQRSFQVSAGAASTMLSMTVMPACPANCGP